MPKFKRGQSVIATNRLYPEAVTIAEIEPKRWWHIQQRYLVEWSNMPGNYDRYKEKQLMAKTTEEEDAA